MAIDLRAKTYCNLGTIISGDFADDYLQNNGLVKTVGNLKLDGIHTPAVGTQIFFAYEKHGNLTRLPRVLRVLSSFADPYRNTTDISMGCRLSYLEQLKPPPTTFEVDIGFSIALPPVTGATLAAWVCQQVGLSHGTFPLTNTYALNRLTPEGGYIALLSDLLVSESYVGYLDETETLRFIDLSNGSTYGPLLSNQEVIDVGAIGVGQLPAASVLVRYNSQRFTRSFYTTPAEPSAAPAELLQKRDWEKSSSFSRTRHDVPFYETVNGKKVYYTLFYNFTSTSETLTTYDSLDRVVKRVETRIKSLGEVNSLWVSDNLSAIPAADLSDLGIESRTTTTTTYVSNRAADYPYTNMPSKITSMVEEPRIAVAGNLGLDSYFHPTIKQLSTIYDPYDLVCVSQTVDYYDTVVPQIYQATDPNTEERVDAIYNTGVTRKVQEVYVGKFETVQGQQSLKKRMDYLLAVGKQTRPDSSIGPWNDTLNRIITDASVLRLKDVNTEIVTNREFGYEARPPLQERAIQAFSKSAETNNVAEIQWVLGSSQSTSYLELSMPFASDDQIVGGIMNGYIIASDAGAKALRFGRAQNALLLGNRNGMNMQLPPELLPAVPFAPLYFTANGATAQYRANANSWTFDASGLVCSTDALFWGGITGNNNFWYPTAPNTTSISISATPAYDPNAQPANTITTPANFDPTASDWISTLLPTNESPTFPTSVTPPASAAPYIQTITLTPTLQVGFDAARFDYPLAFTRTPAPTPLQLVNSFSLADVRYPVPTPLRLSVGTLVVMDMAEEDNFYGSWSQQNYDWNAYLRPGKWGA